MKHIVLFLYIFNIPLAASALILFLLMNKKIKTDNPVYNLHYFIITLLMSTLIDMMSYYSDGIIKIPISDYVWILSDMAYMLVSLVWLQTDILTKQNRLGTVIKKAGWWLMVIYLVSVAALLTSDAKYAAILYCLEFTVMGLVSLGCIMNFYCFLRNTADKRNYYNVYAVLVSMIIVFDYGSYMMSFQETENVFYFSAMTWFAISLVTLILALFCYNQVNGETQLPQPVFQLEEALERLKTLKNLTNREADILREIYYGKSNAQISDKYGISENTVKTHVHNLLEKMGAGSRLEAVYMMQSCNLKQE